MPNIRFVLALLAALASTVDSHSRLNLTKENLQLLDRFHRMVIASKILAELGVDENFTRTNGQQQPAIHPQIMSEIRAITQGETGGKPLKHLYIHSEETLKAKHNDGVCSIFLQLQLPETMGPPESAALLVPSSVQAKVLAPSSVEIETVGSPNAVRLPLSTSSRAYTSVAVDPAMLSAEPGTTRVILQVKFRFPSNASEEMIGLLRQDKIILHVKHPGIPANSTARSRRDVTSDPPAISVAGSRDMARPGICEDILSPEALENLGIDVQNNVLECCRRSLEVDFHSLGWDDWVVAPRKFKSNYCIGRCLNFGMSRLTVYSLYMEIMQSQPQLLEMGKTPCCTPVAFKGLTVAVRQGNNEETVQTLNNIIVDSCGCL